MSAHNILHGDVLDLLGTFPSGHFDAALSDPPYGLKFLGLDWDRALPPRAVWRELKRVLKPGANVLLFGHARTSHRLSVALEDEGLFIVDVLQWLYGEGNVKSETSLKPLYDPIVHARTPGPAQPLNIDGCRTPEGRWPANVILDDDAAAMLDAQAGITSTTGRRSERSRNAEVKGTKWGNKNHKSVEYTDTGYASRFFYCPKVKGRARLHPTQKPTRVTEWLARLLLVPGGRLVVPYAGVGSEVVGAQAAGWADVVGIESSAEYVTDALKRTAT